MLLQQVPVLAQRDVVHGEEGRFYLVVEGGQDVAFGGGGARGGGRSWLCLLAASLGILFAQRYQKPIHNRLSGNLGHIESRN